MDIKKIIIITSALIIFISLIITGYGDIRYMIKGTQKLNVGENETIVTNILRGERSLLLDEVVIFLNKTGAESYSKYIAKSGEDYSNVSSDFDDVIINQLTIPVSLYGVHECWWSKYEQVMHLCINHEKFTNRSSTIRGSMQITTNNITLKENDQNFTLCEGNNYVDCIDGDFYTYGDMEVNNSYVNNDMVVGGDFEVSGIMTGTLSLGCSHVNITGGNITYDTFYMSVLGEGGANDDLVYINGGNEGDVINIILTDSASDITLIHGTGNLDLNGANCALKALGTKAELRKVDSTWKIIVCLN